MAEAEIEIRNGTVPVNYAVAPPPKRRRSGQGGASCPGYDSLVWEFPQRPKVELEDWGWDEDDEDGSEGSEGVAGNARGVAEEGNEEVREREGGRDQEKGQVAGEQLEELDLWTPGQAKDSSSLGARRKLRHRGRKQINGRARPQPQGQPSDVAEGWEPTFVMGQGGIKYKVGLRLARTMVYDEEGCQISKSCHVCQNQHIPFKCRAGEEKHPPCRVSFCAKCLMKMCPGLSMAKAQEKCPRCRGLCECPRCLRSPVKIPREPLVPQIHEQKGREGVERPRRNVLRSWVQKEGVQQSIQLRKRRRIRMVPYTAQQPGEPPRCRQTAQELPQQLVEIPKHKQIAQEPVQQPVELPVHQQSLQQLHKGDVALRQNVQKVETMAMSSSAKPNGQDTTGNVAGKRPRRSVPRQHYYMNDEALADEPKAVPRASLGSLDPSKAVVVSRVSIGDCFQKVKAYDENGMQVSKSCHQCQSQHVPFQCMSGGSKRKRPCKASYCQRCLEIWYPTLSLEDAMKCCPRCRAICNCKACLRQEHDPRPPTFSDRQRVVYAEHILRCSGPLIREVLAALEHEAGLDGRTLDSVPADELLGIRLNCNICATSIADVYRSCEACSSDLCRWCCRERRACGGSSVRCPTCGRQLPLFRLLSDASLKTLRGVAEKYGDLSSASQSLWSWLPPGGAHNTATQTRSANGDLDDPALLPCNRRLAAVTSDGVRRYVFCPRAADLALDAPDRAKYVSAVQRAFQRGEPVIVRQIHKRMDWSAETMCRAVHEYGSATKGIEKTGDITVVDCSDAWAVGEISQRTFFNIYQRGGRENDVMWKVKDWPQGQHFRDRLKRHDQDFREMLPMPEYTDPHVGPLNLTTLLPRHRLPPDLGPKTYLALGRVREHPGGDCVTKLHLDMSDAVNVLCHSQYYGKEAERIHARSGDEEWDEETYGGAGAVWDIVPREDVPALRTFLLDGRDRFTHHGKPIRDQPLDDPLHDEMFFMTKEERQRLAERHGVHPWRLEQHMDEAFFVPAGCPHQVRNLRSCIKIAVDFMAPESLPQILKLAQELRPIGKNHAEAPPDERFGTDKLQGMATMLHAALVAMEVIANDGRQPGKDSSKKPRSIGL